MCKSMKLSNRCRATVKRRYEIAGKQNKKVTCMCQGRYKCSCQKRKLIKGNYEITNQ